MASRGNVVEVISTGEMGVVLEYDQDNADNGGEINNRVRVFEDGKVKGTWWYSNDELKVIDDGTAS